MSAIDRVQVFWEHVPRPFMERVIRCIFDAYLHADDACQDFETSERSNLRPFYRRGADRKISSRCRRPIPRAGPGKGRTP